MLLRTPWPIYLVHGQFLEQDFEWVSNRLRAYLTAVAEKNARARVHIAGFSGTVDCVSWIGDNVEHMVLEADRFRSGSSCMIFPSRCVCTGLLCAMRDILPYILTMDRFNPIIDRPSDHLLWLFWPWYVCLGHIAWEVDHGFPNGAGDLEGLRRVSREASAFVSQALTIQHSTLR